MKKAKSTSSAKPRTTKKKGKKSNAGRPTKMTDECIEKLEGAFIDGLTDEEACIVADIHPATLYAYCKDHPGFSERKELLKKTPIINAKRTIASDVKVSAKSALTLLERSPKSREEWAPPTQKSNVDVTIHDPAERIKRAEARLKKLKEKEITDEKDHDAHTE